MLSLRNFVNEGVKKCGRIFAVFTPDGDGFKYIIASRSLDLKQLSKKINDALSGRGGGSERMIQGSCRTDRERIEKFFAEEGLIVLKIWGFLYETAPFYLCVMF